MNCRKKVIALGIIYVSSSRNSYMSVCFNMRVATMFVGTLVGLTGVTQLD